MTVDPRELEARLRANPRDAAAFEALRQAYRAAGDGARLIGLLERWAAAQPDPRMAAAAYREAAQVAMDGLLDLERAVGLAERALEKVPDDAAVLAMLDGWLVQSGRADRLADILSRHVQRAALAGVAGPALAPLHHRLGQLYEEQFGRQDRAVLHYRKAVELDPQCVPALYAARRIYKESGNQRAALRFLEMEAAAERDPQRAAALWRELAHERAERGDVEGAMAALRRASELVPGDLGVLHELAGLHAQRAEQLGEGEAAAADRRTSADLYVQLGEQTPPEHAWAYFEAALEQWPAHEAALERLERLAEELGRDDQIVYRWVAYLQTGPQGPFADARRLRLGRAYLQAGQPEDAVACVQGLLDGGDPNAAGLAAEACRQLGDAAGRRRALEVLVEVVEPARRVQVLGELLEVLEQLGDTEEAVRRAQQLVAVAPEDLRALRVLERHHRQAGEQRALRDVLLVMARCPQAGGEEQVAWLREAAELSEQLGELETALESWRVLHRLEPAEGEAAERFAGLLERTGRWDELAGLLQRLAATTTEPEQAAGYYRRLAVVHRDHRSDHAAALDALRALRAAAPRDEEAAEQLTDLLLREGRTEEALSVLRSEVAEAEDPEREVRWRRRLGRVLEEQLGDLEGAREQWLGLLDAVSDDAEALERIERIDERTERWDRLFEILSYRLEAEQEEPARVQVLRRMGIVARDRLDDLERAAECFGRAVDLAPGDPELLDALCDVYQRAGRYKELVSALRERAGTTDLPEERAALYCRIGRTLAKHVGNLDAAAEAYERALQAAARTVEALRFLVRYDERRGRHETLADRLEQLAALVEDDAERRELLVRRAEVLAGPLEDAEAACQVLRSVLDEVAPEDLASARRLAELCEQRGDHAGLADALERQLALLEDDGLRVVVAERLAALYRDELEDPARQTAALMAWAAADPTEPEPRRRLVPLLEAARRWKELLEVLDQLAALEDEPARGEAARRAAQVAFERLADLEGAWRRLLPRVLQGDEVAEQRLDEFALGAGRAEELADVYVRRARERGEAGEGELARRSWTHAARIYEEHVGDLKRALEATLRALALDLEDERLLEETDRLAVAAGAFERLGQVYEGILRRLEDPDRKATLLVRLARILEERAGQPSEALDRVLRACSLRPTDDETLAYAEKLALAARRTEELLHVYERRRARAESAEVQLDAVERALALLAKDAEQGAAQLEHWLMHGVAATKGSDELAERLEAAVTRHDEASGGERMRRALVTVYQRVAERLGEEEAAAAWALSRAAHLLDERLDAPREAFERLYEAASHTPQDVALLDRFDELGERLGLQAELEARYGRLVDEALDSDTAALLLERRGRWLEQLQRWDAAADVYQRLRTFRKGDPEAVVRLSRALERAERYQDMLLVHERIAREAEQPAERLEALRAIARTWEGPLHNRWEALEAWQQVLREAPDDEEATEAVRRLGESTRRLDRDAAGRVASGTLAGRAEGSTGEDAREQAASDGEPEPTAAAAAPRAEEGGGSAPAGGEAPPEPEEEQPAAEEGGFQAAEGPSFDDETAVERLEDLAGDDGETGDEEVLQGEGASQSEDEAPSMVEPSPAEGGRETFDELPARDAAEVEAGPGATSEVSLEELSVESLGEAASDPEAPLAAVTGTSELDVDLLTSAELEDVVSDPSGERILTGELEVLSEVTPAPAPSVLPLPSFRSEAPPPVPARSAPPPPPPSSAGPGPGVSAPPPPPPPPPRGDDSK